MKDSHLTLRLPAALTRALARLARARGVPKSQVAREAVATYVASPGGGTASPVSAREVARLWPSLPRLEPGEADSLSRDIHEARAALPGPGTAWE